MQKRRSIRNYPITSERDETRAIGCEYKINNGRGT